jgi:hypothetical protein
MYNSLFWVGPHLERYMAFGMIVCLDCFLVRRPPAPPAPASSWAHLPHEMLMHEVLMSMHALAVAVSFGCSGHGRCCCLTGVGALRVSRMRLMACELDS